MTYLVQDFYKQNLDFLGLELITGKEGLKRPIKVPEVHRAGLSLSGYLKNYAQRRLLIFGKVEMEYLKGLNEKLKISRLEAILTTMTPAVILARRYKAPEELFNICNERNLPLFRVNMSTMNISSKMTRILTEEFSPIASRHGTFVEVFDVGVLIEGDSSIGKSETALGLIERGHRLISDDVVRIKKRDDTYLEGHGAELTRHHMEIRGIGIINVANLYGAFCVRDKKGIDIIIKLEEWNDNNFYDRIGMDETYCDILDVKVPYTVLPVKPGRDVVLLIEAIALNHRLKKMGYHSAKEFQARLTERIAQKTKRRLKLK